MIISIAGRIGSGKDTVADYLCTVHGFKRMSFGESLKDAVSAIFNWDRELVEGSTRASREWREQVDTWWANRLGIPNLTPRWVLQQWGTEVARKGFHDEIWVASVENRLRGMDEDIVITDCRFANEINAVKQAGGITIRTHRGDDPEWIEFANILNTTADESVKIHCREKLASLDIHESEYSSVGLPYDFHLNNNSTIDDLHRQIEEILKKQK